MDKKAIYVREPEDKRQFTDKYNRFYTTFAGLYEWAVRIFPFWKRWLKSTIPHIQGPKVLEVSFGTGYLIALYADQFETHGIDYNERFVSMVRQKLLDAGISADIQKGDVQALPYDDDTFDSIVNTMAFTAYPDGKLAMSEMVRVLKPGGRIILVDVDYPSDGNRLGVLITKAWIAGGDIVRDMAQLFDQFDLNYSDEEIGGFGSVHLYLATKG